MIKFACTNCNHKIGAPEKYAGKRVRCPKCKAPTRVPESAEKTGAHQPRLIKFRCPNCSQKIAVSPDYAGKRVRCGKCKTPLRVPEAPGRPGRPAAKDQTEVLRAGHEQRSEDEGFWGDLAGMDELLSAEASAPPVERQPEQSPADYAAAESQSSAPTSQLPQPGSFAQGPIGPDQPKKKRPAILIGAACVVGFLLVAAVAWYFLAGSGTGETETEGESDIKLGQVKEFAQQYIYLLEDGKIDRATELLTPALQSDVNKVDIEILAKQIGKSKIVELRCGLTHFEQHPEGNQFFLSYSLRYEQDRQRVVVSVLEVDEELRIDGIAVTKRYGNTVSIGPNSYEELAEKVFAPTAKKIRSIFTKFFCGLLLVVIVVALVLGVSMWIVFDKAGEPGWAAFVPGYNMWVLAEVGDKPGWLGLVMFFSGYIPYIGPLVGLVLSLVISIGVAKAFNHGVAFGVGLCLVPFVFYPILAFSSN